MMLLDNDWSAYHEGRKASIENDGDPMKFINPYPVESFKWQSWNQGWNSHKPEVPYVY